MRIQSLQNMETEYNSENRRLEGEELAERKELLKKYKYSIIIEGEHTEFDNLDKWINQNMSKNRIENIYYGKTGYNYGFAEYFLDKKEDEEKLKLVIPCIFTVYPDANPSRLICRSDGYDLTVEFNSSDKNAIIFQNE